MSVKKIPRDPDSAPRELGGQALQKMTILYILYLTVLRSSSVECQG